MRWEFPDDATREAFRKRFYPTPHELLEFMAEHKVAMDLFWRSLGVGVGQKKK